MPDLALVIWIIGFPLVLAVVDLVGTVRLARAASTPGRGPWSQALNIGPAAGVSDRPRSAVHVAAVGE